MTITSTHNKPGLVAQFACGGHLDDATTPAAMTITPGFNPKYISVQNLTTRVGYEWYEGMAATHTLKTAANGDRTDDTAGAIVVNLVTAVKANAEDGLAATESGVAYDSSVPARPAATFTFFATGIAQNDQLFWEARA